MASSDGIDRSKYRNPDMPKGFQRKKPIILPKDECYIIIDGLAISLIELMLEVDCENRPDYDQLTDVDCFLSDSDEDEEENGESEEKYKEDGEEDDDVVPDDYDEGEDGEGDEDGAEDEEDEEKEA